jgi:hypothetical protein
MPRLKRRKQRKVLKRPVTYRYKYKALDKLGSFCPVALASLHKYYWASEDSMDVAVKFVRK